LHAAVLAPGAADGIQAMFGPRGTFAELRVP
jgi:hypothetical protein